MSKTFAVSGTAARTSRPGNRGTARISRVALGAVITLSAITGVAEAQTAQAQTAQAQTGQAQTVPAQNGQAPKAGWEFVLPTGTVVPTGDQRHALKRGKLAAAQLSYVVRPALAITATVGWARSRDIATVGDPKLDVFTYDVGAEVRGPRIGSGMSFKPFAGVGAGARSYNYRSLDVDATHNLAAYGSAGGEIGVSRVRLRVEARNYVTGFKPLNGAGTADTRNDVAVMAGLRFSTR